MTRRTQRNPHETTSVVSVISVAIFPKSPVMMVTMTLAEIEDKLFCSRADPELYQTPKIPFQNAEIALPKSVFVVPS